MLLIIFLGLIAKLSWVAGDCDFGIIKLKNFDTCKFANNQTWYYLLHKNDTPENDNDCPQVIFGTPKENISNLTSHFHQISTGTDFFLNGTADKWNDTGYYGLNIAIPQFAGEYNVMKVHYDSYAIVKHCPYNSSESFFYGLFRKPQPSQNLVDEVIKEMGKQGIDTSQVVRSPASQCVKLPQPSAGECSSDKLK